jgi:aminoglycoside 3'-phosphotransferase-2
VNALSVLSLLPPDWQSEWARGSIEPVESGLGGASLFRITRDGALPHYLKIAEDIAGWTLREEIDRTRWLARRGVRVPLILRSDDAPGHVAMLMEAVPGMPADANPLPPLDLADVLARGLSRLHVLPVAECPFDESLPVRFARAAAAIAAGEVKTEAFAPRNRGLAPEALLARLMAEHRPEDIVVVHGDATLSNILVDSAGVVGFVDCGNAGRGDRYLDLGVLAADIEDHFGQEAAARFARAYGPPAWDDTKARYYADLYELF